jgi:hypothetical protein
LPLPRAPGELRYLLIGDAGIGVPAHGDAMMMMMCSGWPYLRTVVSLLSYEAKSV